AVQARAALDGEAAVAQAAQDLGADPVAAELDLSARLLDELAAEAFLEHGQMRCTAEAGTSGRPRSRRRHAILPFQRRDAEHRLAEHRAVVVAAVHHRAA